MKLEKQVCGLKLAKKLKELGVKQDSLFYWQNNVCYERQGQKHSSNPYVFHSEEKNIYENGNEDLAEGNDDYTGHYRTERKIYSAFTVAELGEMLPDTSYSQKCGKWVCKDNNSEYFLLQQTADTEADARAKMLIYLIDSKLIELKGE